MVSYGGLSGILRVLSFIMNSEFILTVSDMGGRSVKDESLGLILVSILKVPKLFDSSLSHIVVWGMKYVINEKKIERKKTWKNPDD